MQTERLLTAWETARRELIEQRNAAGVWVGQLASSPLATATALSALVLAEQHGRRVDGKSSWEDVYQGNLSELIVQSLHWLAGQQNEDGGWGDTDRSGSNIATTLLVSAAFHLTGEPARYSGMLARGAEYIRRQGGFDALRRRYGRDKTFAVPILTNCALAGMVSWSEVPPLPFELACVSPGFYRHLRLPVVSYALPALVAIGLARFHHLPPVNPITRSVRRAAQSKSLDVLQAMLPGSGGFLEAIPLTSFVVMSLAATGRAEHRVARMGVEFLLESVRADGSWPIDVDLSVWNTVLSLSALGSRGGSSGERSTPAEIFPDSVEWLLAAQHRRTHPMTGTPAGGWAWTDRPGGVPDADDTSGALVALARARQCAPDQRGRRIDAAAADGVTWLLDLQNSDGGWPTFCRGWGRMPFDRSAADLTAHALRALAAWRGRLRNWSAEACKTGPGSGDLGGRIDQAIARGVRFLLNGQSEDGSWDALWFGNQHHPAEANPIYGTTRVLAALRDLGLKDRAPSERALNWLADVQQAAGGWGGGPLATERGYPEQECSVEETALAAEALLKAGSAARFKTAAQQGVSWLVEAVESGRHRGPSPIGFYFAKLWYYERLYPLIFTVSTLGTAVEHSLPPQPSRYVHSHPFV